MFDNSAEFAQLYPGETADRWTFCADRVEHGAALAAIRHRLETRAGIDHGPEAGALIGNLEIAETHRVAGWAQDSAAPERPVELEILADGEVVARVIANAYRRDLEDAGLGSGRHAFSLALDIPAPHSIEVRRVNDHAPLPGSPQQVLRRAA